MLLAGGSPASATGAGYVISHPYHGLSAKTAEYNQHGSCAASSVGHPPAWRGGAGIFSTVVSADAPVCPTSSVPNSATAAAEVQFSTSSIDLSPALNFSTPPSLAISWLLHVNESWEMRPYSGCVLNYSASYSTCLSWAEVSIFGFAFLTDENNSTWGNGAGFAFAYFDLYLGSFAFVQNYSENDYCGGPVLCHTGGNSSWGSPGPGSFVGPINASTQFNLTGNYTIAARDHYTLDFALSAEVIAQSYLASARGTGHAMARAHLNLGSHGNGADLLGVAVT